jgi:sensor c-di-GMP phosphodiesterase-like protein
MRESKVPLEHLVLYSKLRYALAVPMQDQQQNVLAARVAVTLTAALGAATGLLLGCVLAIPLAENRLKTYMERVAVQDDASLTEARSLLDTLGHSANPTCSDTDLSHLRDLVSGSDYVKDAGRIRGGKIECSATAGRPERPIGEFKAGQAQADGTVIYSNLVPVRDQSLRRTGIQRGNVFVVFGSHLPELGGRLPIRLAIEPYQAGTPASKEASSEASSDPATDEVARRGGSIVATHCSPIMSNCVIASMDVDDARRGESAVIGGTTLAGGIAGVFLGIALCSIHRRSLTLHQQLKHALAREQLRLAYQPIVNLANGKIVGAEALARWTRPDGVSVSPGEFIKTAEEHGFIGSLTNLVMRRALKEFREVLIKLPDFRLNINIAAADLMDPQFLPMIEEAVQKANVRPSSLTLEVTETSAANHEDALESIRVLRRMGFGISIDDFGTGYSNLSYLLYLSADSIKIDKAFTRTIGTDAVTAGILPQIIAMARTLNLAVVVEGIESPSQADYFPTDKLRIYGQGWLYGRPVPAGEFFSLIGVTVDQSGVIASPETAEIPSGWRQLKRGVGTAIVQ